MPTVIGFLLVIAALVMPSGANAGEAAKRATIFKSPECGCCEGYVRYLRAHGYAVTIKDMDDVSRIKRHLGVPEKLESCHTMLVDGYAVEGHVPVQAVDRLFAERPPIRGISLPGMLPGSPGMDGRKTEPFVIYEITREGIGVFDVR